MVHDMWATRAHSGGTMQIISSLHLHEEVDGGALVIDDQTLSVAHLNKAAHILLAALRQPRTREELEAILAQAANCHTDDAVAPVAQFVSELTDLDWIELRSEGDRTTEP
ncbi:hypothetical protein ACIBJI_23960 [Nocardia sp. NPDC050408]|uniref:hypothetical protein n=1 Tax=Nocardia sp. NPDC050408 TaxID=3364319 RepID=UPI0037A0E959